jgi:hypothetical protein
MRPSGSISNRIDENLVASEERASPTKKLKLIERK